MSQDAITPPPIIIGEPPLQAGDTQPRATLQPPIEADEPKGCGTSILVTVVAMLLIAMFVMSLAFAGFAGYRDGGIIRQTDNFVALAGTLDGQATLAWDDLSKGNFEIADARCKYVIEKQSFYAGMKNCISTAQAALNATPTFTPSRIPSATPLPALPTATGAPNAFTPESLLAQADEAIRVGNFSDARDFLESLRGVDATFRKQEVETKLVDAYLKLAAQYKAEGESSLQKMVIVIRKALEINPDIGGDWRFTADATGYYLSAKGYLEAQNYAEATRLFRWMMDNAPTAYSDVKTLACRAFTSAGDVAAIQQYSCQ